MKKLTIILLAVLSSKLAFGAIQATDFQDRVENNGLCSLREAVQVIGEGNNQIEPACSGFGDHTILLGVGTYELLEKLVLDVDLDISGAGTNNTTLIFNNSTAEDALEIELNFSVSFDSFLVDNGYIVNDGSLNSTNMSFKDASVFTTNVIIIKNNTFYTSSLFGGVYNGETDVPGNVIDIQNSMFLESNIHANSSLETYITNTTLYGGRLRISSFFPIIAKLDHITITKYMNDITPALAIIGSDLDVSISNTAIVGNSFTCEMAGPGPISIFSGGYNVFSELSVVAPNTEGRKPCLIDTQSTDIIGTVLEPITVEFSELGNHGGLTPTILPAQNSILVDAIPANVCTLQTDQRGLPRPAQSGCDIGAVELQEGEVVTIPESAISVTYTTQPADITLTEPAVVNALAFTVNNSGDLEDILESFNFKFERLDDTTIQEQISAKLYVDTDSDGVGDQLIAVFSPKTGVVSVVEPQVAQTIAANDFVSYVVALDFNTLEEINAVAGALLSPWLLSAFGMVLVRSKRSLMLGLIMMVLVVGCGDGSKTIEETHDQSYSITLTKITTQNQVLDTDLTGKVSKN